ncbi:hypothetical protein [Mesorhizobium sp. M0910]|uniref:hypothetical protein n=1 Tax=Mesorhizobium sp. M0910 TaxID=2957025 RepID=UPI00333886DD
MLYSPGIGSAIRIVVEREIGVLAHAFRIDVPRRQHCAADGSLCQDHVPVAIGGHSQSVENMTRRALDAGGRSGALKDYDALNCLSKESFLSLNSTPKSPYAIPLRGVGPRFSGKYRAKVPSTAPSASQIGLDQQAFRPSARTAP